MRNVRHNSFHRTCIQISRRTGSVLIFIDLQLKEKAGGAKTVANGNQETTGHGSVCDVSDVSRRPPLRTRGKPALSGRCYFTAAQDCVTLRTMPILTKCTAGFSQTKSSVKSQVVGIATIQSQRNENNFWIS